MHIDQTRQSDGSYKFMIAVGGHTIREVINSDPRVFNDIKVSRPNNIQTCVKP